MKRLAKSLFASAALLTSALSSTALADDRDEIKLLKERLAALEAKLNDQDKKIVEQDKKVEETTTSLASEIKQTRLGQLLPEKKELKSQWGMGPAASSVYNVSSGLSIGGYGEMTYQDYVQNANGQDSIGDTYRLVTYIGYKFSDNILSVASPGIRPERFRLNSPTSIS